MERLVLLAVTAHPGDELAMAGTLAKQVEAGVHVVLACATGGGVSAAPFGARPEGADEEEERRLRCACAKLGVEDIYLLGYRASGPHGEAAGTPGTLASARAWDVVRQLVDLIRSIRPQVMITFGPDGMGGHVDHRVIGGLASQAFGATADLELFPAVCGPETFAPSKLFHVGLPEGLLSLAAAPTSGTPDQAVAAREDVSLFVDLKAEAARCYGADLEPQLAGLFGLPAEERRRLLAVEYFNLAQPQPGVDDRRDPHLFAGIP